MRTDELDSIFSQTIDIIPSTGFTSRVMDAVRLEAADPSPIAFPWKRAIPGFVGAAIILVVCIIAAMSDGSSVTPAPEHPLTDIAKSAGLGWILISLLLTLVSVTVSMGMIRRTTAH